MKTICIVNNDQPLKFYFGLVKCAFSVAALLLASTAVQAQSEFKTEAYQYRLSSFIDGALIDDERALVKHGRKPPNAQAQSGVSVEWAPHEVPGWRFGGFMEQALWVEGAEASIEALAFANNKRVADRDASYPFSMSSERSRRWGVSIGKEWDLGQPGVKKSIWVRGKGFLVDEFRAVRADGVLQETISGNVGLNAAVTEKELGQSAPFVSPKKTLGYGWGIDAGAEWGNPEGATWRLEVKDLGPSIKLDHVLATRTQYNTNNASFDADGYINYTPVLTGKNSDEPVEFTIRPKLDLNARWMQRPGVHLLGGIGYSQPFVQSFIGVELARGDHMARTQLFVGNGGLPISVGLGWQYKNVRLNWRGDSLSPSKARIWMMQGSLSF